MEETVRNSDVEIIPNRQQIDNRFPVLGFTVKTGGLAYYEVLVTTDRQLYAPDRAPSRNAANFFSSRQANNQLQRTDGTDSVYVVPASVLSSFAQGEPKPLAIYYTLIAYGDENGGGAAFAHPAETLAENAPSVAVAPGFTGQTLSAVLGVSAGSLRRVEPAAAAFGVSPSYDNAYQQLAEPDEGEAEDGFSLLNMKSGSQAFNAEIESPLQAEDGYELNQRQAESYGYEPARGTYALDGYEDGFEYEFGAVQDEFSRSQESIFPEGASEPDELYDSESPYFSGEEAFSYLDDEEETSDSFSSSRESDFEYAGASAGASRSELGYRKNGHSHEALYSDRDDVYREDVEDFDQEYGDDGVLEQENLIESRAAETGECSEEIAEKRRIHARKKIVEAIAKFESGGSANPYKAINADQEFAAWKWHPAFGKYHIGLSYGIVQFTQDGGSLGKLLEMMRGRDKAVFDKTFGGAKLADELVKVTTASGSMSKDVKGGRSARVQPVDGADVWLSPWRQRFEAAADHVPFQAAQNELANSEYLAPILQFCSWFGLDTDRAVAMVYDRAVQMGVGGGKKWVASAVGPVQSTALQQKALTALGKKDLKELQKSVGLKADGDWGPMSHAAMVSQLRALGTKSPVPIPTRDQMMDAMVRAAAGKSWEHRVKGLRSSKDLTDTNFAF